MKKGIGIYRFCSMCNKSTNHLKGVCQDCKPSKEQPTVKVDGSMTAMQELIGQLNGAMGIINRSGKLNEYAQNRKGVYVSVLDVAKKLLELERKQIIGSFCEGCKNPGLHKTHIEKAVDFYNSKYNK